MTNIASIRGPLFPCSSTSMIHFTIVGVIEISTVADLTDWALPIPFTSCCAPEVLLVTMFSVADIAFKLTDSTIRCLAACHLPIGRCTKLRTLIHSTCQGNIIIPGTRCFTSSLAFSHTRLICEMMPSDALERAGTLPCPVSTFVHTIYHLLRGWTRHNTTLSFEA